MERAFEYHVIGELFGVSRNLLEDISFVESALIESVMNSGLTLFDIITMRKPNGGVLSIAIIGESHAAVHTWPESGSITVSISSCKDAVSTWRVFWELKRIFGARDHKAIELRSGILLLERAGEDLLEAII
ncbi:S-adenosylmethionine decarboxylase [Candidatus Korarchaeum cryptofilum]|jgi:S-adenosylmethionine decarboxylase|uniref:S-adenosylmethionine decarboxylase related n=1 Tax=Korarchaeum cryptofilum (strain OPF8) TaxID=374847 RepID=B1L7L2_KORCO|nr:S-adenosylmethionine decarboxylase [Candidatus Korarchaeum cryptofilum]ACB06839.1 S-adenosylmethionine decarboxylase related [Candidatus Korarchaeum cryptofilum OPF8]